MSFHGDMYSAAERRHTTNDVSFTLPGKLKVKCFILKCNRKTGRNLYGLDGINIQTPHWKTLLNGICIDETS